MTTEDQIWNDYLSELKSAYAEYIEAARSAWMKAQQRHRGLDANVIEPTGPAKEPHPMFIGKKVKEG